MSAEAAARCARSCCARLCSNVGLCALVAAYALLGAALFEALEADFEGQQQEGGRERAHRRRCLRDLWDMTLRLNVLHRSNWTHAADARLRRFEREVAAAAAKGGIGSKGGKSSSGATRQWTFSGALLYSVTVITTIGYGNLAPRTPEGKLLTMLYALIGVPLVLLCVSNLGALLAGAFQFAYSQWTCASQPPTPRQPSLPPPPSRLISHPHTPSPYSPAPSTAPSPTPTPSPRPPSPPLPPAAVALLAECAAYNLLNDHHGNDNGDAPNEREKHIGTGKGRYTPNDGGEKGTNGNREDGRWSKEVCGKRKVEKEKGGNEEKVASERGTGVFEEYLLSSSILQSHRTSIRTPLLPSPTPSSVPATPATPATPARVPAAPVLLVLVAYICGGAAVFAAWEEWSFLDGAYFCFITLSTIGFGDLVPGKSFERAGAEGGHLQLVACCAYLLLGLVLIAMAFNLLQEEAVASLRRLGARLRPPSQR